jgi:hypothetical protein
MNAVGHQTIRSRARTQPNHVSITSRHLPGTDENRPRPFGHAAETGDFISYKEMIVGAADARLWLSLSPPRRLAVVRSIRRATKLVEGGIRRSPFGLDSREGGVSYKQACTLVPGVALSRTDRSLRSDKMVGRPVVAESNEPVPVFPDGRRVQLVGGDWAGPRQAPGWIVRYSPTVAHCRRRDGGSGDARPT